MSGNHLSTSQLDLVMHGPDEPTAPGHSKPAKTTNINHAFLQSEKKVSENVLSKRSNGPSSL